MTMTRIDPSGLRGVRRGSINSDDSLYRLSQDPPNGNPNVQGSRTADGGLVKHSKQRGAISC